MAELSALILTLLGLLCFVGFGLFGLLSRREREPRAVRVSWLLAVPTAASCIAAAVLLPAPARQGALLLLALCGLVALTLFLLPIGRFVAPAGRPERRVDEREIMFARKRLREGTPEYAAYYAMRPEHKAGDDKTRELPGLLSPQAKLADPVAFASAAASFGITESLRHDVNGPVANARRELDPLAASVMIKRLTLYHGAVDVGVTELQPYHVYTHIGRGTGRWGDPIRLEHHWAVAFSVEMDHGAMQHAPGAEVVAESARQYVESAKIAIQLAAVIRSMGYAARAHIDGNYRVIAPLVARDAGLGEIGRMGLLMTPRLGPRVRLGVVTTDLPLVADRPGDDLSVIDFCSICKKCAENCPSQSIPCGDCEPIESGSRCAIDAESCFRYWNVVGTDCGRCMTVCPYSHPDNAAHNLVRWTIRRSGVARRVMLRLDDLFYGRRPKPAENSWRSTSSSVQSR
jgi:ferredoxin